MRASAFAPEVSRLLGVDVGRMLTLGWALAAAVGALAGMLVVPTGLGLHPHAMDLVFVVAFTAAVVGGLDSPAGAVVGGLLRRPDPVVRHRLPRPRHHAAGDPRPAAGGPAGPSRRALVQRESEAGVTATRPSDLSTAPSPLRRSLPGPPAAAARVDAAAPPGPAVLAGAAVVLLTNQLPPYQNLQVAGSARTSA